jgi:hypothetical protein
MGYKSSISKKSASRGSIGVLKTFVTKIGRTIWIGDDTNNSPVNLTQKCTSVGEHHLAGIFRVYRNKPAKGILLPSSCSTIGEGLL